MDRKFFELNILKGKAYYLKDCKYLDIGFDAIPKVLNPGNKLSNERINELASEDVCAKTTILL
jgi:hypothetical protein